MTFSVINMYIPGVSTKWNKELIISDNTQC